MPLEISAYRSANTRGIVAAWNQSIPAASMTLQRIRDLVLLDVNVDAVAPLAASSEPADKRTHRAAKWIAHFQQSK